MGREPTKSPLQLVLTLRSSLTARLVAPAMEETQVASTNSLTRPVSHTLHASSTLLTTFRDACARLSIPAVTAPGHPTPKATNPSTTALPSNLNTGTTSVTTISSRVLTR